MQIFLGAGLSGAMRRGRGDPPGGGAPRTLRPPALRGDGRIGATLAVDPGDWSGAERFAYAWLKGGAPIPGAAAAVYAPTPQDDRAAVSCRVTAVNSAGRTAAATPAITIAFAPPASIGVPPDIAYRQDSGPFHVDISPFFSGGALRFSVTGDGVTIDPQTGVATFDAAALGAGVTLKVVAENSGGRAEIDLRLRVATVEAAKVPPALVTPPSLSGTGRVGEALAVDPGVWSGDPVPGLALQWLCDGAPLADATGPAYAPGAAEDGREIACRVTASNLAGAGEATTPAIRATQTPPLATGTLPDVTLAVGADRTLAAAAAFSGAALRFTLEGEGARIDPETGEIAFDASIPRAPGVLTVVAANSGGAARLDFAYAAIAAPVAVGTPAPGVFAQGARPASLVAAPSFAGADLAYALEEAPAGVAIDAASGVVTIVAETARTLAFTVRATNAVGTVTQAFAVRVLAAPVAVGTPAPVFFVPGAGSATISAQALFAGPELVYAIEGAPAGVTINAGSGLVTVSTETAFTATLVLRAVNAAGVATQSVPVAVRPNATVFDAAGKLADVGFRFTTVAPSWTYEAGGFARATPGASDRAHGEWAHARGDARYRALVRAAAPATTVTDARPFGFVGRLGQSGANFFGIGASVVLRATTTRVLEIRQFTGTGNGSTLLATADVAWAWDAWQWIEMEFDAATVRARVYAEAATAPAWQAVATATYLAPGGVGPSVFASGAQRPVVDLRRIEVQPLVPAVAPVAPSAADWALNQIMVQE